MSAVSGGETERVLVAPGVKPPLAVPRRLLRMRSDAALAERFAAGDEAAFDVIYERHRPVVLAVCMGVLGTPPDAEDATQETFSALAVALRTRPPAELRPWLIRVARNASIDTTRRRRHRLLTLDGEIPETAARPAGPGQAELAVVLDGIRELPEGQRMALLMRELGGHSYSEIAEFLATDEEAVKGLIARARVGLRTYREATELSCAAARNTIAAEPDGRRYDKTIRRHLRGCASCRAYREAMRDDAKALRAALPIQAGTVATGSLASGMLTAAKGSLLGYGLTQAATTCAASACAVGAIGGMVFVAPVHKLGLPPILPAITTSVVHNHTTPVKTPASHRAAVTHVTIPATTVTPSGQATRGSAPTTSIRPSVTHAAALDHHQHVHVTRVVLPDLPKQHETVPGAGSQAPAAGGQGNGWGQSGNQGQSQAQGDVQSQIDGNGSQSQGNGNGNGNHGAGGWRDAGQYGSVQTDQAAAATSGPTVSNQAGSHQTSWHQASPSQSAHSTFGQGSQDGNGGQGHGNGAGQGRWGDHGHGGNPMHTIASVASAPGAADAAAAGSAGSAGAPTVTASSSSATASASDSGYGWGGQQDSGHRHGWGAGQSGSRHGGAWQQSAVTQSTCSTPTSTVTNAGSSNTTSSSGWGSHRGHGWGQQQGGASSQNGWGSGSQAGWGQ